MRTLDYKTVGMMATLQKMIKLFYNRTGQLDKEQVTLACGLLSNSGIIALPTDTLYGIAAKASDSKAIERIYQIKGRDQSKPLAVCVSCVDAIQDVAHLGRIQMNAIKSLLPGPITFVLNRTDSLNKDLNPGVSTIGVRVPDHNFIRAISDEIGPLALTSANRSGETSPLVVDDFSEIWNDLDCIFDAGSTRRNIINTPAESPSRAGSTVIDLSYPSDKFYRIIREGCAFNRVINTLNRLGYRRKY